jgi:antitoxin component of MazEF toxin-antitoxin module
VSASQVRRSGEGSNDTPKTFRTSRVRKTGHSVVVSLPVPIRNLLGCKVGDQIAFRRVGRVVVISVIRAYQVIQISDEEKRKAVEAVG